MGVLSFKVNNKDCGIAFDNIDIEKKNIVYVFHCMIARIPSQF